MNRPLYKSVIVIWSEVPCECLDSAVEFINTGLDKEENIGHASCLEEVGIDFPAEDEQWTRETEEVLNNFFAERDDS